MPGIVRDPWNTCRVAFIALKRFAPPAARAGRQIGQVLMAAVDLGNVVWTIESRRSAGRIAYADAPGQATFDWNMGYPAKDASEEIDLLFREILPELG